MTDLQVRGHVPGSIRTAIDELDGRRVVVARCTTTARAGALSPGDGASLARAAELAVQCRLPLVLVLSTAGADIGYGVDALHGWGTAARALSRCSGSVPVLALLTGPAVSGPALLLGMADVVVMTSGATAYVSSPSAVATVTGVTLSPGELGGVGVHQRDTGLCAVAAGDEAEGMEVLAGVLRYLPDHTDDLPPVVDTGDPPERADEGLGHLIPAEATASYDVRHVLRSVVDDGELLELQGHWAAQIVTALASVGGIACGIVANQPRTLAGTLDIRASQKAARFVRMCDAFNLPVLTVVDTPGFLPGKDLEWRGMIRHGAELAFAHAEATVPRVCLVLRKAFGGAYIVMDSKGIGNDLCLAWPTAEIAVMGAKGAAQILHRRATVAEQAVHEAAYAEQLLTPWLAAERGFVDAVIEPSETRATLWRALSLLRTKRERLRPHKHDTGPQ